MYRWCMSRTNIDLDDSAVEAVMRRYRLTTKRDAVNLALRTLAAKPLALDRARALRDTGSPACIAVEEALAGARDERHLTDLRGLLARVTTLDATPRHYEEAALLYRQARTSGHTVRRLIDCLIARIAIDNDVPLLQADRDVTALTHCSALRLASPV